MRTVILAQVPIEPTPFYWDLVASADLLIAADGGAANALKLGVLPHVVVGDLDSLEEEARHHLEAARSRFLVYPRDKDETDTQLALNYALEQGATEVLILGALGGERLDHTLANILLLALPLSEGVRLRILDEEREVFLLRGGEGAALRGGAGDLVSLLPLSPRVEGIHSKGLRYPLEGASLSLGFPRGVSNELLGDDAHLQVGSGLLLVVVSHCKHGS